MLFLKIDNYQDNTILAYFDLRKSFKYLNDIQFNQDFCDEVQQYMNKVKNIIEYESILKTNTILFINLTNKINNHNNCNVFSIILS